MEKYTEDDLTGWIAKNRMRFLFNPDDYTAGHLVELAVMCGFDRDMAIRRFSHLNHALALTSIDAAARQHVRWTVSEFLLRDKLDLSESWDALGKQLINGLDFHDK